MNVAARFRVYPRLGRVSNLPTIATQAVAAILVTGASVRLVDGLLVATALACAYVAGMFLNDAFDAPTDRRERPERPIPAGLVLPREVFAAGGVLLGLGVVLLGVVSLRRGHPTEGLGGAFALALAILLYDAWHKGNPLAPAFMGLCRALVYVAAGLALEGTVSPLGAVAAVAMFVYVVGLSEVARSQRAPTRAALALAVAPALLALGAWHAPAPALGLAFACGLGAVAVVAIRQSRRGSAEGATVTLLMGISLIDASLVASLGHPLLAASVAVAMLLTRRLQAWVRGT